MADRILCWFSCGAASAVATKMAITRNKGQRPLVIAYTRVLEEHPDNMRFLKDCEAWFGQEIVILQNEEYKGSIYEVFLRTGYLVGAQGAACTRLLKKEVRKSFERPGDTQVFGYLKEEMKRVDRFIDANPSVDLWTPLVDADLTKSDCLAILRNAGIELPMMYRLGYHNNNCIGCVKGSAGYWNKIRIDFPDTFERMSQVEQALGRTINRVQKDKVFRRVALRDLPPDVGDYKKEPKVECGISCEYVEREINGDTFEKLD